MSTTLKEWLLKTIAELEQERNATPGVVNVDAAMALAAMKLALASLEAKAMTQVLSSRAGNDTSTIDKALPEGTMLYTAPPALVSVPDELTREEYKRRFMEDDNFDDTFRGGWNACRAAMLQNGNSPAQSDCCPEQNYIAPAQDGNSPVIPDGWVLVPEEPTHEMLEAGDEQFGTYDVYRRMIAASPQQEVKP